MSDLYQELRRLILDGLCGRTEEQLFEEVRALFKAHHQTLAWDTFRRWVNGRKFPATQARQDLLGEAVGGPCGAAIKLLKGPELAFRAFRAARMKEKDMSNGHGRKSPRNFVWVQRDDGPGRLVRQAQIACTQCGATYHHSRRGEMESDDYFRNKGWEVGSDAGHDICPLCVAQRKVVKMSDHTRKPPEPPVAKEEISKRDRRAILLFIQDHWDEGRDRYEPGWSDVRIAEATGKPVAVVKEVREAEFDGPGEDPGVVEYIAQAVALKEEMGVLHKDFEELSASFALSEKLRMQQTEKDRQQFEKYKEKHNKLHMKVHEQAEKAERLQPLFLRLDSDEPVPSMPLFAGDMLADTEHLTNEEFGVYHRLLYAMWRRNGWVPDDDVDLARICHVSTCRWQRHLKPRMLQFLIARDGELSQKKLLKVRKNIEQFSVWQRENSNKRWHPDSKKNNGLGRTRAQGMPAQGIPSKTKYNKPSTLEPDIPGTALPGSIGLEGLSPDAPPEDLTADDIATIQERLSWNH